MADTEECYDVGWQTIVRDAFACTDFLKRSVENITVATLPPRREPSQWPPDRCCVTHFGRPYHRSLSVKVPGRTPAAILPESATKISPNRVHRLRHAASLMAWLKVPAGPRKWKPVSPKGGTHHFPLARNTALRLPGLCSAAIRPRWSQPETLKKEIFMTESTNTQTVSKKPTHLAYHSREAGEKSYLNRIGAAWQHKDGGGFTVQLDTVPLDGRVVIFPATEKKA